MATNINITLYKPFVHQKAVHDALTRHIDNNKRFTDAFQKIFVVKACRQVGKSAMALNELARFAFKFGNSISGYIAPTLKLSRKTYEEMLKMFKDSSLIARKNSLDLIIEFINGSVIRFFSGEQRDNLRSYTISGILVIDESAFMTDDIYNECISPWVDAKKAVTLMISTPKFKTGFFYHYYTQGLTGDENVQSFDFTEYDLTVVRSEKVLEQKQKTMPVQVFKSEYLGLFIDMEGSVFGDFSGCLIDYNPTYDKLYFGLDFGTGKGEDYTVLTAFNERYEQVMLWRTNTLSPVEQIDKIAAIYNEYRQQIKEFLAEQNSIGAVYLDMLKRKGCKVTAFNTDSKSKRKIVENFQTAIEQNVVKLKNDVQQSNELSIYEANLNPKTNNITYNAPTGFHDDHVMALMLAYEALYKTTRSGMHFKIINTR